MFNNFNRKMNIKDNNKLKVKFNISASSLKVYTTSQLQFYFQQILKLQPDTTVNPVYGNSGNVVHNIAETFINSNFDSTNISTNFDEAWKRYNLDTLTGFNGKILNKDEYKKALDNTINYIKTKNISQAEWNFLFPLINDDKAEINLKGFADALDTDNHIIFDWKTNSKKEDFLQSAKIYCLAYYKTFGKVPKAIYYYCKLDIEECYTFTEDELKEFDIYIQNLAKQIANKGFDISQYSTGDWNNIWNTHKNYCLKEVNKRENSVTIDYDISKNHIKLFDVPKHLNEVIDKKFSYFLTGHEFSQLFQSKRWDGKAHLYSTQTNILPLGLLDKLTQLVKDYNEHFEVNYSLKLRNDYRKEFEILYIKFKDTEYELRDYQLEAIDEAIKNKIGIVNIGTGGGKSLIAAEIIRTLKSKTLFIINRIELVEQTCEMFEEYLGIKPGKVSEGEMELNEILTVVSIQSVAAILKRNDETTKKLVNYLNNVNVLIFDEAHTVKDAGMYQTLAKFVVNTHYIIGLTGTAFRNDEHTLKMNSLVGSVVYKKTTEELVDEGHLVPVKCYFIENKTQINLNRLSQNDYNYLKSPQSNYAEAYDQLITHGVHRNMCAKKIIEMNPDKKILVLTKLIKHGKVLNELIPNSRLITSSTKKNERKEDFEDFKDSEYNVLIGSYQIFSTGINLPDLNIIINMSANATTVGTVQSIGRAMRKSDGKNQAYYFDFNDTENRYFRNASKQRMQILQEFGHEITKINMEQLFKENI